MAKITYITSDNQTHTVEVQNGLTVMEGAVQNDIPGIDADCGGGMACATCHVYVKDDWFNKIPKKEVPKFVFYILGPIIAGLSWEWVSKNIGYEIKFDNTKSIKGLGIQYKDAKETLVSHVEQLEKSNLIFNK